MHVHVTQSDIDDGCFRDKHSCPIAKAIKRLLPPDKSASVYKETIIFKELIETSPRSVEYSEYTLPKSAQLFVERYDSCCHGKPFRFEINSLIPHPTQFK